MGQRGKEGNGKLTFPLKKLIYKGPALLGLKKCLVRYLHLADRHPAKLRKTDEILADALDFEHIIFPVKIKDIHKIEK